ncbi:hypothetical protein GCM10027405_19690 [Arthrobacter alkaliphilus]
MDLAGFNHEIDVVIGYEGSEALRDPFQFEFQNSNPSIKDGSSSSPCSQHSARQTSVEERIEGNAERAALLPKLG